ncbi:threonine ammonia-lyase, biosynthetic [Porticoccus sp. GXU_MW_L64]
MSEQASQASTSLSSDGEYQSASEYLRQILLAPVGEVAVVTPLSDMPRLSQRLQNTVSIKREDRQPVHSYKLRGAYNKLVNLSAQQKAAGVVAASAGNHAQGVVYSATRLGIDATIVMPETTPEIKVEAVRALGGNVVLHGAAFDDAGAEARRLSEEKGWTLIPPFDDPDVIAGQGTLAKELLQQNPELDTVFVPVGGGGLLAGVAVYLKQMRPDIKIVGVESDGSACFAAALEAGKLVDLEHVGVFADGVAVKRMGEETYRLAKEYTDEVIQVDVDQLCAAIKDIFEDTRAIAEPAGAVALAGLKKHQQIHGYTGRNLAAILSGSNLNFHTLRYISERCELGERREALLAVKIPERKGSFREFCGAMGGRAITEFNYRYVPDTEAHIFVGVQLQDADRELPALKQELESQDYWVDDYSDNELAKLHVRYMMGGSPKGLENERLFNFEVPETPGSLMRFLEVLGDKWNISLFHFRNHGASVGQALAGIEVPDAEKGEFIEHLDRLGYIYTDESDNPAYQVFLASRR